MAREVTEEEKQIVADKVARARAAMGWRRRQQRRQRPSGGWRCAWRLLLLLLRRLLLLLPLLLLLLPLLLLLLLYILYNYITDLFGDTGYHCDSMRLNISHVYSRIRKWQPMLRMRSSKSTAKCYRLTRFLLRQTVVEFKEH